MANIAYFSFKNLLLGLAESIQGFVLETKEEEPIFDSSNTDSTRARFRVSVNDLKVISSALLYYKKFLLKRKDFDKAEAVAQVDERIYQLILSLDQELEAAAETIAA